MVEYTFFVKNCDVLFYANHRTVGATLRAFYFFGLNFTLISLTFLDNINLSMLICVILFQFVVCKYVRTKLEMMFLLTSIQL